MIIERKGDDVNKEVLEKEGDKPQVVAGSSPSCQLTVVSMTKVKVRQP